jgi:hypothetical protein
MELDSALSQMWSLLSGSNLVSKMNKARKNTKNHYYRDDPGFMMIQVFFLTVTTIAYGLAMKARLPLVVYNVIYQLAINYVTVGALVATATWSIANNFLMGGGQLHEIRKEVDWQHGYDIHCNAYFVYFFWTHVVQFALLPFIVEDTFFAQILGNTIFVVGVVAYCYTSFQGYLDLPTLVRQQVLMYPAIGFASLILFLTLTTRINLSHVVLSSNWAQGS